MRSLGGICLLVLANNIFLILFFALSIFIWDSMVVPLQLTSLMTFLSDSCRRSERKVKNDIDHEHFAYCAFQRQS